MHFSANLSKKLLRYAFFTWSSKWICKTYFSSCSKMAVRIPFSVWNRVRIQNPTDLFDRSFQLKRMYILLEWWHVEYYRFKYREPIRMQTTEISDNWKQMVFGSSSGIELIFLELICTVGHWAEKSDWFRTLNSNSNCNREMWTHINFSSIYISYIYSSWWWLVCNVKLTIYFARFVSIS